MASEKETLRPNNCPPSELQSACRRDLMSGAEIQWYCGKARSLRLYLSARIPPHPPLASPSPPLWPITWLRILSPQRSHAWTTELGANGAPAEAIGSQVRVGTFSNARPNKRMSLCVLRVCVSPRLIVPPQFVGLRTVFPASAAKNSHPHDHHQCENTIVISI